MFGTKLMRGNRTVKVSANCLDAFNTPNVCRRVEKVFAYSKF